MVRGTRALLVSSRARPVRGWSLRQGKANLKRPQSNSGKDAVHRVGILRAGLAQLAGLADGTPATELWFHKHAASGLASA